MRPLRLRLIVLTLLGGLAGPARADLSTNLTAGADTSLFETNPDNNLGASDNFPAGTTAGTLGTAYRSRGLVKFDLTALPPDATITSASLSLQLVKAGAGPGSVFGLYRVLRAWGEGTGTGNTGSPANPGEATWNNRMHPSTAWDAPGANAGVDYVASASATRTMDGVGVYTFDSNAALVADVQAWLANPGTNFGWILISQSEDVAATARRFASRENMPLAPILNVHYTAPASPVPATLSPPAILAGQFVFAFTAEAGQTYTVEARSNLSTGSWSPFTNIPAQPSATLIGITDTLAQPAGFYRLRSP